MDHLSHPRILHVVRRLDFGGLQVGVVNLIRGLDRLGFVQAVCCLEERGELAEQLPGSVPVWACAEGRRPQRLPWIAARHLRAWRPDVIHARNSSAWIDATAAWLLAGQRGRLAFSFHGFDRLDRMPRGRAFVLRRLAQVTWALAAVSAEAARQFAAEIGIPPSRFTVLNSGIDTNRFCPVASPRRPGRLVLGCVARLAPIKAHDLLIKAFALQVSEGTYDLELRLIGDGPLRADLERLVRNRGLRDRVRFLGMTHDIAEQLRELDLFVLASHREGRPMAIMEALATGLPIIATRVGSVPELVIDGQTGLLVEPGDVEGLARAIGILSADCVLRHRCAEAARRGAVAHLSLDRMLEQYRTFYQDIAQARAATERSGVR